MSNIGSSTHSAAAPPTHQESCSGMAVASAMVLLTLFRYTCGPRGEVRGWGGGVGVGGWPVGFVTTQNSIASPREEDAAQQLAHTDTQSRSEQLSPRRLLRPSPKICCMLTMPLGPKMLGEREEEVERRRERRGRQAGQRQGWCTLEGTFLEGVPAPMTVLSGTHRSTAGPSQDM